ncbi:hypothetical protein RF11_03846 [Thelohanellus kitauei]|uniref:Uncharacterized protein n=1 Tax=Thelohanellus kitauei TaxID=669202 RepID=A0A0C2MKK8_THEKT|nr:hypothetical protein RF11_03846 [Thelohanellus kitauei]
MFQFSALFLALFALAKQYKESVVFVDGKRVDDPAMKEKVVSQLMTNPTLGSLQSLIHPAGSLSVQGPSVSSEAVSHVETPEVGSQEKVTQRVGFGGSLIAIGGSDGARSEASPSGQQIEFQQNGQPFGILRSIGSYIPRFRFHFRIRGRIFCTNQAQPESNAGSEGEINPSWILPRLGRLLSRNFPPCEEDVEVKEQPVEEDSKPLTQPTSESLEDEEDSEAVQLLHQALEALNSDIEQGQGAHPKGSYTYSNVQAVRPLSIYEDFPESEEEMDDPFFDDYENGQGPESAKGGSVAETVDCASRHGCEECTRDLQCFYCADGGKCLSSSGFFNKIVGASSCPASQIYYFSTCKVKSFTVLFFITIGLLSVFSVILSIAFIAVWRRYRRNKVYQFIREKEEDFSPEAGNAIIE